MTSFHTESWRWDIFKKTPKTRGWRKKKKEVNTKLFIVLSK